MLHSLIVTQDGYVVGGYLNVQLIAMLGAAVMPLLVSFIVKKTASNGLRAVINILATAIMAVLALWVNPGDVPVTVPLIIDTFLFSFITSLAVYKGLWSPTGVTDSIANKTANFGIGTPPAPTMETDSKEDD